MQSSTDKRGFSFGENWLKYLDEMPAQAVENMRHYVADWLGDDLAGCRLVDVGSGQGLTSLAAFMASATVVSFDVDPASVAATSRLWDAVSRSDTWSVEQGSILDAAYVGGLGTFDVVVSWGVLHHTGHLREALTSTAGLVAPEGRLWIALYHRTRQSGRSLRTKRFYSALPGPGKVAFRSVYAGAKVAKHLIVHRSLRRIRDYPRERGMTWRRDIEDWLGGLPYEVSSPGEVVALLRPLGFELERLQDAVAEGGNDVYLFRRTSAR